MWILSIVVFAVGTSGLAGIEEQHITKQFKSETECRNALREFSEADVNKNVNFLARCMAKEQFDQLKKK